ncbi:hypothetical protein QBC33DRAFT_552284 [Phialemonium atrogriseum]|uniref:Uncharacterized protein n=1 Tax=Phialemonium atrogriseum TaxID=1093897 RepID=A0AAJ0BPZ8_9PEZI|nr:uncharacterized protein QBC33DRAFT_552284 [Phialemonium atrogriseum]KAK1762320.1 hypothetical protein QBC33DRAFT_552284 [Phialemonium atrogriseum]
MAYKGRTRQDLSQNQLGTAAASAPNPMAAITSLPNPVNTANYLVFYNSPNNRLAAVQQALSNLGGPLSDAGAAANTNIHSGFVANPSTLTSVLFQSTVNVYGVLDGTTKGDLFICRLSPGFELLNIGSPPVSTPSSIAACGDGGQNGTLFYLAVDGTIRFITLPGTQTTSKPTPISLSLNPTTYLGAVYGTFTGKSADSYVGLQTTQGRVYVCSGFSEISAPIQQSNGLKNTPIAMVFVNGNLIVYFLGPVGSGPDSNTSPVCRAVTDNLLNGFYFSLLDTAPSPNGYTQLTAFPAPAPGGGSPSSVILSYVQDSSNQLVSWEDDLTGIKDGRQY